MPAIYHEGGWIGNATDPEVLVKDTVGWTGKNGFNIPSNVVSGTYRNVDCTVNRNSNNAVTSIVVNNQAQGGNAFVSIRYTLPAGDYIFSSCPSGGSGETYNAMIQKTDGTNTQFDFGDGILLSIAETTEFYIYPFRIVSGYTANNLVFKPMIRKASIEDPTFEAYHDTVEEVVEQIYADNGVLGAKNLLPNELKAKTVGGVTVTINDDNSVTLNGTSTETLDNLLELSSKINDILEVGKRYVLTGCPANGGLNSYALVWRLNNASAPGLPGFDDGDGSEFTWQQFTGYVAIRIRIQSGYTCNNLTFKPMIRLASDPDDTYQPYAMTNAELTEKVTTNSGTVSFSKGTPHTIRTHLDRVGNVCVLSAHVNLMDAEIDASTFVKVGTVDILPQKETMFVVQCAVSNAVLSGHIKTNGDIEIVNMQNATVTVNTIMFQCAYITA